MVCMLALPMQNSLTEEIEISPTKRTSIFFVGESLAPSLTQKDMSYVADAISGNSNIGETNFEDFHNYTIDWQSGPSGYINWYIDGEFIQRIDASALKLTGAIIPEEPMYLILNTAMSSHWVTQNCHNFTRNRTKKKSTPKLSQFDPKS